MRSSQEKQQQKLYLDQFLSHIDLQELNNKAKSVGDKLDCSLSGEAISEAVNSLQVDDYCRTVYSKKVNNAPWSTTIGRVKKIGTNQYGKVSEMILDISEYHYEEIEKNGSSDVWNIMIEINGDGVCFHTLEKVDLVNEEQLISARNQRQGKSNTINNNKNNKFDDGSDDRDNELYKDFECLKDPLVCGKEVSSCRSIDSLDEGKVFFLFDRMNVNDFARIVIQEDSTSKFFAAIVRIEKQSKNEKTLTVRVVSCNYAKYNNNKLISWWHGKGCKGKK